MDFGDKFLPICSLTVCHAHFLWRRKYVHGGKLGQYWSFRVGVLYSRQSITISFTINNHFRNHLVCQLTRWGRYNFRQRSVCRWWNCLLRLEVTVNGRHASFTIVIQFLWKKFLRKVRNLKNSKNIFGAKISRYMVSPAGGSPFPRALYETVLIPLSCREASFIQHMLNWLISLKNWHFLNFHCLIYLVCYILMSASTGKNLLPANVFQMMVVDVLACLLVFFSRRCLHTK